MSASESCVTFFRILPSQAKAGDGRLFHDYIILVQCVSGFV
jgi:hypothetical protein